MNLIWLDVTKQPPCRSAHAGQTRSWSCSGLWRATSWEWCQWTSVTTEPSPPPAPSTLTSVSGTWSLENRSNPWMQDQVRAGLISDISVRWLIYSCSVGRNHASCSSASEREKIKLVFAGSRLGQMLYKTLNNFATIYDMDSQLSEAHWLVPLQTFNEKVDMH